MPKDVLPLTFPVRHLQTSSGVGNGGQVSPKLLTDDEAYLGLEFWGPPRE